MSRLAQVAQRAISLVAQARDEAREELSDEEFDELDFFDDLEAEFYEDPSGFVGKYGDYLGDLSDQDRAVLFNRRTRK